jgi:hypothetical protein
VYSIQRGVIYIVSYEWNVGSFISLRGEIFDRKTNLTWPLLNKVTVSTKESERSYISVLGV